MLNPRDPHGRPSVPKLFFETVDESHLWLRANRGPKGHAWKRCGACLPGRQSRRSSRPRLISETLSAPDASYGELSRSGPATVLTARPTPVAFAMPSNRPLRLPLAPRLASWNRTGDPDQVRLAEYLAVAAALLRPQHGRLSGPLALRLDVGLPRDVVLLEQRDLDNYLIPLATHLTRTGPSRTTSHPPARPRPAPWQRR